MASNLEWIIKKLYPNQKVIVWAHNEHIAKAGSKTFSVVGKAPQKQFEDMGEMVRNDLKDIKDKSYYIGFYLNQGTAADIAGFAPYKVGPMPKGTLENLFVQSGLNNAFIDMSCEKKQTPQNSWMFNKTLVSEDGMTSSRIIPASVSLVPNEQYDGIVFINKVNSPDYTNIDFKGYRMFTQNPDLDF
jgi:erythromycin esterase